ncbi:restriction endonuclease [Zeimonas arvi]|uniref:Restriction endonuclease n=1 Tax=Zeimonas arvi TaxID=2498847 RepID=A0A5C8NTQ7_9BURK|nr:restriction endonuclease [Zeimonas arvi]TXL64114.1 restriction endonuclease [Zeimonas arvi]
MARKGRSSALEDMADLVSRLPWWAGVALAVLAYLLLSPFAGLEPRSPARPGETGVLVGGTMLRTLASIGQYLAPFVCLIGAGMSAWRRSKRDALVAGVTGSRAARALDAMSWREFEMLVGEAFRLRGFRVAESGGAGPDGGVDLVLKKGAETFLVQCKQWKALKVGVDVVRELYGVMAARGAAGGFVVTSGRFTDDARRFAEGRNVKLVDGDALTKLLDSVPRPAPVQDRGQVAAPSVAPQCPRCGGGMVMRRARRGANSGSDFWGCAGYPACRGTRPAGT